MINTKDVINRCKKVTEMVDSITNDIEKYMQRKVYIDDADDLREDLIIQRKMLYNIASWYHTNPELCRSFDTDALNEVGHIHNYLQSIIMLCNSAIACLDRYIAECYCTDIECVFNPCLINIEATYVTSFKELCKNKEK